MTDDEFIAMREELDRLRRRDAESAACETVVLDRIRALERTIEVLKSRVERASARPGTGSGP
jgi:hypothetical protein